MPELALFLYATATASSANPINMAASITDPAVDRAGKSEKGLRPSYAPGRKNTEINQQNDHRDRSRTKSRAIVFAAKNLIHHAQRDKKPVELVHRQHIGAGNEGKKHGPRDRVFFRGQVKKTSTNRERRQQLVKGMIRN